MTEYKVEGVNPRLFESYDCVVSERVEGRVKGLQIKPDYNPNAISVLRKRYFRKNEDGAAQEDVGGLLARVATNVAYPEFKYQGSEEAMFQTAQTFYEMMANREFMPNSPTLMNAGREMQQLSACFVLPVEDHMRSIFGRVYDTAMVHKTGGGTGFSFGNLRRKNDFVSSTYGKASGPVSFIGAYDAATHSVNQGGFRRGANMGMMPVDHPDILEFIHAKENEKDQKFEAFNFSVLLSDSFMQAIKNGEHYVLRNPREGKLYDLREEDLKRDERSIKEGLISPEERVLVSEGKDVYYQNPIEKNRRGKVMKVAKVKVGKIDDRGRVTLDARIVFDEIAQLAWKNGEPGIAFIDRMNAGNPTHTNHYREWLVRQETLEAAAIVQSLTREADSNTPLEVIVHDYLGVTDKQGRRTNLPVGVGVIEATNPCGEQPLLGYEACNLGSINLGLMVKEGNIDYDRLGRVIDNAVKFLDNVVTMSNFPLEPITETVWANRKIGLGVMGFADMLGRLEVAYDSNVAVALGEDVMKFIQERGLAASERLAEEKGAYPNFKYSAHRKEKPRRNATVTTIAPTGTISIIAGASGGMEPWFALTYMHRDADGQEREFIAEPLVESLKRAGVDSDKVLSELKTGKKLKDMQFVPEKIRRAFVTSGDISVEYHVKMQAAFQKYTDNAVSKTVNLPNCASVEDVEKTYWMAYEAGCKGITVYRDGSRSEQVLTALGSLEKKVDSGGLHVLSPRKRPAKLRGDTIRKETGCGNMFTTVNYAPNGNGKKPELFEIFAKLGKAGGCSSCQTEAIGRLVSYLLRSGADAGSVASQLIGIRCHRPVGLGSNAIYSCADAIGKSIAEACDVKVEGNVGDSENFSDLIHNGKENGAKPKATGGGDDAITVIKKAIKSDHTIVGGACPQCGSPMVQAEGCLGGRCTNTACGHSECS